MMTSLLFPDLRVLSVLLYPRVYLPDFMTRARRELMDSADFLIFFWGAMVLCRTPELAPSQSLRKRMLVGTEVTLRGGTNHRCCRGEWEAVLLTDFLPYCTLRSGKMPLRHAVAALAVAALAATALAKDHKGSTKRAQKQHALHKHFSKLDIYNQQNGGATTTTAPVDPRCPVGSLVHNMPGFENICAWRPSPATNWGQGEALCQQEGGHMASFKNKEEFFFIQSLMGFQGDPYWIGLHKMDTTGSNDKNIWVFSDGANPEYSRTQWLPGQPNNHGGKQFCAEVGFWNNIAQINDETCSNDRPYLCIKQVAPKVEGSEE